MKLAPDALTRAGRWLTGPSSPTADLYFAGSCRDLLASGSIRQMTSTVFQSGRSVVVIRHALGLKTAIEYERLIYVIDDDWRAGLRDPSLPPAYRAKLAAVEARAARKLEVAANRIVTGSEALAADYRRRFPQKPVDVMLPAWPLPAPTLDPSSDIRRIACLGSWTHAKDIELVEQVLLSVLESHNDVEVVLSGNISPSRALQRADRLRIVPAMSWPDYTDWLRNQRFDIGLYPLRDTAFNRARSINKILEYLQTGAVTLVSEIWSPAELQSFDGAFFPVANDSASWSKALTALLSDGELRKRTRESARRAMLRLDMQTKNRSRWVEILELDGGTS